jgi:NADH-quinone oxidoreductase subunit C
MAADTLELVAKALAAEGREIVLTHGVLAIVAPPGDVAGIVSRLHSEFAFDLFLDVTAVDWPAQEPRFEVVWHFYSTKHFVRVRVKTRVAETDPVVDSLTPLYGAAACMERECHEMYGIRFRGNADLRPMLLYEGFVGHPLRKDYVKEHEQPLVPYRK